jgi:hypothetical protein
MSKEEKPICWTCRKPYDWKNGGAFDCNSCIKKAKKRK